MAKYGLLESGGAGIIHGIGKFLENRMAMEQQDQIDQKKQAALKELDKYKREQDEIERKLKVADDLGMIKYGHDLDQRNQALAIKLKADLTPPGYYFNQSGELLPIPAKGKLEGGRPAPPKSSDTATLKYQTDLRLRETAMDKMEKETIGIGPAKTVLGTMKDFYQKNVSPDKIDEVLNQARNNPAIWRNEKSRNFLTGYAGKVKDALSIKQKVGLLPSVSIRQPVQSAPPKQSLMPSAEAGQKESEREKFIRGMVNSGKYTKAQAESIADTEGLK